MTNRVYLRPLRTTDVNQNYLNWFNDPLVTKFLEIRGKDLSKKIVDKYIQEGRKSKTYYMYAICFSENKKHIGNLKIGPINKKHNFSDLVTVIGDREYWGKGLAVEAIKLGIEMAFKKYKIRKLSAGIYSGNKSSIKAYKKAGFVIEGKIKDQFIEDGKFHDKVIVGCFNPQYKREKNK